MKRFFFAFLAFLFCHYSVHSQVSWFSQLNLNSTTGGSFNNNLVKSTSSGWDGVAVSNNFLPAGQDGWVEFTALEQNYAVMVGFTSNQMISDYSGIDHTLTMFAYSPNATISNHLHRHESGVKIENLGFEYDAGDRFRLWFKGNDLEMYINYINGASPVRVLTGVRNPSATYYVAASIGTTGGTIHNVTTNFDGSGNVDFASNNWITNTATPSDSWTFGKVGFHVEQPIYDLQVNGVTYLGGTTPTVGLDNTYRLYVENGIRAERVKVDLTTTWADYVFERDYPLASLAEVKAFIDQYHHLPGIPDAATVEQEGIDLGEMNVLLLEKIEELTLHMIRLSEDNADLRQEIDEMKKLILTNH